MSSSMPGTNTQKVRFLRASKLGSPHFMNDCWRLKPQSETQKIVHASTIRQFNVFLENHRVRENAVTTGIPPVMWLVVLIGAVLNIALIWLFDMKFVTQLFLGGILSFFLGMMIMLIGVMDRPFQGSVSVSSEPFQILYWTKMRDF